MFQETIQQQDKIIRVSDEHRINLWLVLLGIVPRDPLTFESNLNNLAVTYENLKQQYLMVRNQNPLAPEDQSRKKLKYSIEKDIIRTYQEYPLFQQAKTQQLMSNVLMIWSLQNPTLSYRQGMNELIAVIIHASVEISEHIIYFLFCALLDKLNHQEMFRFSKQRISYNENPLLKRINYLYREMLRDFDKDLFTFLSMKSFQPEIFLIRWYKCLMARELSVSQTLYLWDQLFFDYFKTQESGFKLLDHVILNFILEIRDNIIKEEHDFEIIRKLLNYDAANLDLDKIIYLCFATRRSEHPILQSSQDIELASNMSSAIIEIGKQLQIRKNRQPSFSSNDILSLFRMFNMSTAIPMFITIVNKHSRQNKELKNIN